MSNWNGEERRKNHQTALPQCLVLFERIEGKIDNLIERTDKINGRYDKHIEESKTYRQQVIEHEVDLKNIKDLKRWWWGAVFAIACSIVSLAVIWGMTQNQVKVNTGRLDQIETSHQRICPK